MYLVGKRIINSIHCHCHAVKSSLAIQPVSELVNAGMRPPREGATVTEDTVDESIGQGSVIRLRFLLVGRTGSPQGPCKLRHWLVAADDPPGGFDPTPYLRKLWCGAPSQVWNLAFVPEPSYQPTSPHRLHSASQMDALQGRQTDRLVALLGSEE